MHWLRQVRQHIAHLPGTRAQLVSGRVTYFVSGRPFASLQRTGGHLELCLWLPPSLLGPALAAGQGRTCPQDPQALEVKVRRPRELEQALAWVEASYEHNRER